MAYTPLANGSERCVPTAVSPEITCILKTLTRPLARAHAHVSHTPTHVWADDAPVTDLAARWRAAPVWLVRHDGDYSLFAGARRVDLDPMAAEIAELIGEGAHADALARYRAAHRLPPGCEPRAIARVRAVLSPMRPSR